MVKRLLSLVIVALVSLTSVQAQTLQRSPAHSIYPPHRSAAKAPAKAASLDGTTPWALTDSENWGALGLGANVVGVQFSVAIHVPGNSVLAGSAIQGINIPVADAKQTNVAVWVRQSLDGSDLARVAVDGPFTANEFKTVTLDEPVVIPEGGLYVGYDFTNGTDYSIAFDYDGEPVEGGLFLRYVYGGKDYGWEDYSADFPPSPLQVLLSGVALPDYAIDVTSVGSSAQTAGSAFSLPVTFTSNSAKEITSLDADLTVDGTTVSKHIDLASPIASGFNGKGSFTVEGTSPAKLGTYEASVRVTKVNGQAYENTAVGTGLVKNLTKVVARRTVIEEFTGTGCGWCPRGWVGMEYMKATHPDDFIGIAFHKYNQNDPLYYSPYPLLGLSGAPGCVIDRKEQSDPYYGNSGYDLGIELDFQRLNAELPEVDVNVSAQWNEEQTAVDIFANVEFLADPTSVSLVYVLTADSLNGTTTAWRQSNYYYQYAASEAGNAPGISDFCKGGQYGQSSVYLTFNDAVIGSSYKDANTNLGQTVTGAEGYQAGSTYKGSYTISQPTSATVQKALRKDLVTAIVLVVDNATGQILNAAKNRVQQYATAVAGVAPEAQATEAARYNAAGVRIATPQRGLNLIRFSDGTVRKVLVK